MEIVTKVMEKSWKCVGKNVYEPWLLYETRETECMVVTQGTCKQCCYSDEQTDVHISDLSCRSKLENNV